MNKQITRQTESGDFEWLVETPFTRLETLYDYLDNYADPDAWRAGQVAGRDYQSIWATDEALAVAIAAYVDIPCEAWKASIVAEIDTIPDNPADSFTPEEVGRFDFDEGRDCEPTEHYSKLGDIERYVISWKIAKGELEMTADYEDAMEDVEFIRRGC